MTEPLDKENRGASYEDTQCPAEDCSGQYAGTEICPYGCTKYTGGEKDD